MSETTLPPFPVDPGTLDLLWTAINPGPDAERSSVGDFLSLMSQLGGSDVEVVVSVERGEVFGIEADIYVMRDPAYHDHDVIRALIAEVRRLRAKEDNRV